MQRIDDRARRILRGAAMAAAALMGLGLLAAPPAAATLPGDNGRIAYDHVPPDGNTRVWTSNPDGSDAKPLPFAADPATTNVGALLGVNSASWGSDGSQVAVSLFLPCAFGANCSQELALVDVATGRARQLTCDGTIARPGPLDECRTSQGEPAMSPDGSRVAVVTGPWQDENGALTLQPESLVTVPTDRQCTFDPLTGSRCQGALSVLTNDEFGQYHQAAWSPDGRWLVAVRTDTTPDANGSVTVRDDVVAVRADGSGRFVNLTADLPRTTTYVDPDWSPDGRSILVGNGQGGQAVFPITCGAATCTRTAAPNQALPDTARTVEGAFSPDGTRLVFTVLAHDNVGTEIWTARLDGGDLTRVTSYAALGNLETRAPAWQPVPRPPAPTTFPVTVSVTGSGRVTSDPAGIDCPGACTAQLSGPVTLTARPATGFQFVGWGGACGGTTPTCTLTVTASTNVSATYAATPPPAAPTARLVPAALAPPTVTPWRAGLPFPLVFTVPGVPTALRLAPGGATVTQINCTTRAATGTRTAATTTPNVGLVYSSALRTYAYPWATSTAWRGTCRQLNLTLTNGTVATLNVRLT